jgi:arginase
MNETDKNKGINRRFLRVEQANPYTGEVAIIKVPSPLGAQRELDEMSGAPDALLAAGLEEELKKIGAKVAAILEVDCTPDPSDVPPEKGARFRNEKANVRVLNRLAQLLHEQRLLGRKVIVIGGDHSINIGTIAGASAAAKEIHGPDAEIAEVDADAHGDAHTKKTSPSMNLHGATKGANFGNMEADDPMQNIHTRGAKMKTDNLSHIGARDLDPEEIDQAIVDDIQYMTRDRVRAQGLLAALDDTQRVRTNPNVVETVVSIDVDGLHQHATPMINNDGIRDEEMTMISKHLSSTSENEAPVTVIEIAEFSPMRDINQRTAKFLNQQIVTILGARPAPVPYRKFRDTKLGKYLWGGGVLATLAATGVAAFFTGKSEKSSSETKMANLGAAVSTDTGFKRDASSDVTGMSGESTFLPVITPDWKHAPLIKKFSEDFGASAKRYKEALASEDGGVARTAEREMLTYFQAALIKAKDNPVERKNIVEQARNQLEPDQWTSFADQISAVGTNPKERDELQKWMKLWQL